MKPKSRKQFFLSDIERDLIRHALMYLHKDLSRLCDNNSTQKTAQSFCQKRIDNLAARFREDNEDE